MTRKKQSLYLFLILLATLTTLFIVRPDLFFGRTQIDYSVFHRRLPFHEVHVNTQTAADLAKKVRVLCFVTTVPKYVDRYLAVRSTWVQRCTRHFFVTSSPLPFLNASEVLLLDDVPEGRGHLTAKTFGALLRLYRHHLEDYDWFIKADDDSYVIVENLRVLLSTLSPLNPVYLGHHFRRNVPNGYMSGGASYVLSRQALRILGQKGLPQNGGICKPEEPDEDVEVGRCLQKLGVQPYSTIDSYNRESFHPWNIHKTLFSKKIDRYSLHPKIAGPDSYSQLTITFHYVDPSTMYLLEMLLYRIDVYGRHPDDVNLLRNVFNPKVEHINHRKEDDVVT